MVSVLSGNGLPTVLVISNETLFADSVCAFIENYGSCDVVGKAASAEEAIERTRKLRPDVVLLDTAMPTIDSEHVIRTLHKDMRNVHVLLIGHETYAESIFRGIKAGAKGYVSTRDPASVVISAIIDICSEEYFLSPSATKMLVAEYRRIKLDTNDDPYHQLTNREREVLAYIAEGHGSQAIANHLHISYRTVLGHRAKINRKLDIHNTTELVKYAIQKHLITIES
ncbi:LuxR C-terminal-related transcriptional regulator [Chloroflexota bacterium]